VQLAFEMYLETPLRKVSLELSGVREVIFNWAGEGFPHYVAMLKCLWTSDNEFYLSLDPYDERDVSPSNDDNEVFRSSSVVMTVETLEGSA